MIPYSTEETPWEKLSKLTILKSVLDNAWQLILIIAGVIFFSSRGSEPPFGVFLLAIGMVVSVIFSVATFLSLRFRVNEGVLEKKEGIFSTKHSKMKITLIRSVSQTRTLPDRILGLATLKVQTGSDGESFSVDGLTVAAAEALRTTIDNLRAQSANTQQPGSFNVPATTASADDELSPAQVLPETSVTTLAKFSPSWVAKGAMSGPGLFPILAIFGVFFSFGAEQALLIFDELKNRLGWLWRQSPVTEQQLTDLTSGEFDLLAFVLQLGPIVLVAIAILIPLHYLGNVVYYMVSHFKFELKRTNPVTLESSEGLFSTKTNSVNTQRMRGAEVTDGVLSRWLKVAQLNALLTVGEGGDDDQSRLLPRAPQKVVHHVADQVLPVPGMCTEELQEHGPKARRRLLVGAAISTFWTSVPLWAVIVYWNLPWQLGTLTVLFLVWNVFVAFRTYAHLGHTVLDNEFVTRSGFLVRKRKMVTKKVTIGMEFSSNPFQRRLGVTDVRVMDTGYGFVFSDLTNDRATEVGSLIAPELMAPFQSDTTTTSPEA